MQADNEDCIDFITCKLYAASYHHFFFFWDSVSLCDGDDQGTGNPPASAFGVPVLWAYATKLDSIKFL